MNAFGYYLLSVIVITIAIVAVTDIRAENVEYVMKEHGRSDEQSVQQPIANAQTKETQTNEARGLANSYEVHENYDDFHNVDTAPFSKHAKPLKNIFMGIYKNYKSTYLGNKTSAEYKQRLKDRVQLATALADIKAAEATIQQSAMKEDPQMESSEEADEIMQAAEDVVALENIGDFTRRRIKERLELMSALARKESKDLDKADGISIEEADSSQPEGTAQAQLLAKATDESESSKTHKKRRKRKRKTQPQAKLANQTPEPSLEEVEQQEAVTLNESEQHLYSYDIGGGVNVSLDTQDDIVSIKLDGNNLMEVVSGRWLHDNTEEGRGKKYEMVTKVLPLFILPFLIQSAIVPFLVTKLKLLLMKSILVGKLAIFLLIISAIKNSNKPMQTYEVAPSYWAGEPSRRSELATAASSMAYNGYRVEGKPAAWVN